MGQSPADSLRTKMKLELEQKLVSMYPKMFSDYGGDPKDTCVAFGFECGDGWFTILEALCHSVQGQCDYMNRIFPQICLQGVATQVKEKYGSLRFYLYFHYTENLDDLDMERVRKTLSFVDGMVSMAEAMSERVCGQCGSTFRLDKNMPFPHSVCGECEKLTYKN